MLIRRTLAVAALVSLSLTACGDGVGPAGPPGPAGSMGTNGEMGPSGAPGTSAQFLALPGDKFYPESITATADGTLYIGSLGTGQIWKIAAGSLDPVAFVGATAGLKNVAGVLADNAAGLLWACEFDAAGVAPSSLRAFGLSDGMQKKMFTHASLKSCNDMTLDGKGALYVADSKGAVLKLAPNGTMLTVWSMDPALAPVMAGGFGADGIAFDGGTNLYVNHFEGSKLFRIPIKADGSADVLAPITVTPALKSPDGMRSISPNSLIVVENNAFGAFMGGLVRVDITGNTATRTTLSNRLDKPTAVVQVGKGYWVSEGQLNNLFAGTTPNLPFLLQRIPTGQ